MKFFQKHQKRIVAIIALLLALLMILPAITMIFEGAGAVTQEEIDKLKEDAAQMEKDKEQLEEQLEELKEEIDSAFDQKLVVEQQILVVEQQIANTQALIDEYSKLIAQEEIKLGELMAEEAEKYDLFCRRVRAMEEEGTVSYWHILFNAASFSDLLDKAMMVSEIMEYDNAVMAALEEARIGVEEAKAALEETKDEQVAAREKLDAQNAELKDLLGTIETLLAEMQEKKEIYEEKINHLDEEFDDVEAEIKKKQEELRQQQIQMNTGSGYIWPLDGRYVLSSLTGGRIHPITGVPETHLGIDIPAYYGTPIKAARGGIVIVSTHHWSYGNYVVVDHGNGDSTLYAHMSSRSVKVGQTVKQGDVVGLVGSTGSSNGNHLHFEVKVGYVRQDPVNYYPKLTFWVYDNYGRLVELPH